MANKELVENEQYGNVKIVARSEKTKTQKTYAEIVRSSEEHSYKENNFPIHKTLKTILK